MFAPAAESAQLASAAAASSSTSAAAGPSVVREDEPTTLKRCSSCAKDQPESHFSSVQLKKKGKRVCSGCVVKKVAQQKAATSAAALAAKAFSASSTSAAPAHSEPESAAPLSCIGCGRQSGKLRTCSKCGSCICSSFCHSNRLCEALCSMPPLSLSDEDCLSRSEFDHHWSGLLSRMRSLAGSNRELFDCVSRCADLDVELLTAVLSLYPPRASEAWWGSADKARYKWLPQSARLFFRAI